MSQAGANNSSGGGGSLPVTVPTSFTIDTSEANIPITAGTGTAISGDNNYVLTGDNGIQTVVDTTNTKVVQFRFVRNTDTTTDDTPLSLLTLPIPTNSTLTFQVLVAGRSAGGVSCGAYATATVENTAGVASIVDQTDFILNVNPDGTLADVVVTAVTSGANYIVQVTGIAATTINWSCCLPGITIIA